MTGAGVPEEREVKLTVDADFTLPPLDTLPGVTLDDRGTDTLRAVYLDTDDLALAHAGVGLRHRNGTWTYKGRSRHEGDSVVREEREVEAPDAAIPAELQEAVAPHVDVGRLRPIAVVVTERHTILVDRGRESVELVHDRVTVESGPTIVDRFTAVEVEYEQPSTDLAGVVVQALTDAGAVLDRTAKYVRALRALGYDVPDTLDE
ncbi:MAG: CYTH domain-containing protein [Candidatus Dormibacteraeota bacterium]|nr:CYTH domain-containing protein [Candidatus Dormibacteraeota bacterium]